MKNNNNKISLIQILSLYPKMPFVGVGYRLLDKWTKPKTRRQQTKRFGFSRGKQSLGLHYGYKSKYYFLANAGNRTFCPSKPTMALDKNLKVFANKKHFDILSDNEGLI